MPAAPLPDVTSTLDASVSRLRAVAEPLTSDQLRHQAYPTEWTIADVLSHLGSGAVILRRRIEDAAAGETTPPEFAPSVWDEWNAKSPEAKRADALVTDAALVDQVRSLTPEQTSTLRFTMGPMELDLAGLLGLRLNEHVLHSWDIAVALDPSATLAPDATELVVDNLGLIARFTGKPTGSEHEVTVATTEPRRAFVIAVGTDAVSIAPGDAARTSDVELPAEAFARLVYGRLDPAHTPRIDDGEDVLEGLRAVFRGV
jgi:uncharacterized protein (TIGR03083 family)